MIEFSQKIGAIIAAKFSNQKRHFSTKDFSHLKTSVVSHTETNDFEYRKADEFFSHSSHSPYPSRQVSSNHVTRSRLNEISATVRNETNYSSSFRQESNFRYNEMNSVVMAQTSSHHSATIVNNRYNSTNRGSNSHTAAIASKPYRLSLVNHSKDKENVPRFEELVCNFTSFS